MSALVCDIECTISNKGNPYDLTNKLVMVGTKFTDESLPLCWDWNNNVATRQGIQDEINNASFLVGFNLKFDLAWLRRVGVCLDNIKVWDCQLCEFLLNNQKTPYPSLNDCAIKYGLAPKLDVVEQDFWSKGIDTDAIPREILSEYLAQDLNLTQQVYEAQLPLMKASGKMALFKLQCADLLCLADMEYSGIKFNTEKALAYAETIDEELETIRSSISNFLGNIPFNSNSNDHVSAALYGGTIYEDIRIPVGIFKTGARAGQVKEKTIQKAYELPRLCEPIKGTETAKSKQRRDEGKTQEETLWEVNDTVLRKLKLNKEAKKFVTLLTRHSELEKLSGTYLRGYTKLIAEMNWQPDMLHGQFNQCVAITGRLSSSRPNLQNADPKTKTFMESRF